jgi:O-antigen/teichoic acid export membrane protein
MGKNKIVFFRKILKSDLLKNGIVYIFTDGIYQGIPFLILPVLSYYLSPEDYGIVSNFTIISNLLIILLGLSSESYLSINFYKITNNQRITFIQSYLIVTFYTLVVVTALLFIFKNVLFDAFNLPYALIVPVLVYSFTQKIENFFLQILRFENKKFQYLYLRVVHVVLDVIISLFLVIKLNQTYDGRIIGMVISSLIIIIVPLLVFNKNKVFTSSRDKKVISFFFKYGLSLIPHSSSNWVKAGFDRAIITKNFGLAENGLYSSGSQVGLLLGLLLVAINKAFSPFIFQELSNSDKLFPPKLKKFIFFYIPILIIGTLFFSFIGNLFIVIFFSSSYQDSTNYVLLISISQAINGLYLLLVNFVFYYKKTIYLSIISILSSVIHIVSCYFLIQHFQAIGAAYANIISTSFLTLGVILILVTQIKK